jgi:glutaredoxin
MAISPTSQGDTAQLYRMVMPDHLCPYGLKSKALLEGKGFQVEDHHLTTHDETEGFKRRHQVETTPQAWIDGQRIGGYDELRRYFGEEGADQAETTLSPRTGAIHGRPAHGARRQLCHLGPADHDDDFHGGLDAGAHVVGVTLDGAPAAFVTARADGTRTIASFRPS